MNFEYAYKELLASVIKNGELAQTRNAETLSLFGTTLKINTLRSGRFPLITSRKMYIKGIAGEMAALLHGPKHVDDFKSKGCNYWGQWAEPDGSLTLDYGNKWINWYGINQIEKVLHTLRTNPKDRRMIITGWDPSSIDTLSLPCCHILYQFHVDNDGHLNMVWYQRSADLVIGVPSDIVLGALFIILMANAAKLKPGTLTMMFGDTHIYKDHLKGLRRYLSNDCYEPPKYTLDATIHDFEPGDLKINNYSPNEPIKFKLHG